MNQTETQDRDDLELLAGFVLGDLSDEEHARAESILKTEASSTDILEELERTAAGVQLTLLKDAERALPESLAHRIRQDGMRLVGAEPVSEIVTPVRPTIELAKSDNGVSRREWVAWLCAAAALLIAVAMWSGSESAEKTASIAREELIRNTPSILQVDWSAGKTPFDEHVSGDVVWDAISQKGYMRFENMPVNDPTVEQYQLWIIDPERDDEPVDGGVFDITATGEVVVEIDAKLNVISPAAFAITIEKPGGVVVSTQERLPLLAAVQ